MQENTKTQSDDFSKIANRVAVITIFQNLLLSVFKLIAGILGHSNAMISDAVHSASDVFSTAVVIIGVRAASKAPDKEHPYGHERLESIAAILLAMVLLMTGLGIGFQAARQILRGNYDNLTIPGTPALAAAMISITVKEAMYWYTRHYAKKIESSALMADAWHHRSDALSSVGALIGIGGAMIGFPVMDPLAGLVIFFFIAKAAFDIFNDATKKMVDHSCDPEIEKAIYERIKTHPEVLGIDLLRTRIFGNKIYVDLEIRADASLTLKQAHDISAEIHRDIENAFPKVKHIMIHINPA